MTNPDLKTSDIKQKFPSFQTYNCLPTFAGVLVVGTNQGTFCSMLSCHLWQAGCHARPPNLAAHPTRAKELIVLCWGDTRMSMQQSSNAAVMPSMSKVSRIHTLTWSRQSETMPIPVALVASRDKASFNTQYISCGKDSLCWPFQ